MILSRAPASIWAFFFVKKITLDLLGMALLSVWSSGCQLIIHILKQFFGQSLLFHHE